MQIKIAAKEVERNSVNKMVQSWPRTFSARPWILVGIAGILLVGLYLFHLQAQIDSLITSQTHLERDVSKLNSLRRKQDPFQHRQAQFKSNDVPFERDLVVIYNRVPKTGSTSFVGVAYDLCKPNAFHVLHLNISANMHVLTLPSQARFVQNVTDWREMRPAFFHGHLAFVDFQKFGSHFQPVYINLVRQPLDRLVSYYYFLRHGDDFRPHLVRRKHGDNVSFDECVQQNLEDCNPDNMWLQIPFFCGHAPACWEKGNEWALEEAKKNLLEHYMVVGVTEQMEDFISLLELTLPSMFRGAGQHFALSNRSHLRKTSQKTNPLPETVARIQQSKIWKMENEFYEFALVQFGHALRKAQTPGASGAQQIFFYEKIRPK
ncbi:heparin sulfate O-sulfotransferase [Neocloeon triangulifer]|uniref:heparin sulfate O-sulfotransferase n=1 Tax=Neocloeon triangulifer TaxID=2078957 RepID=UPI00286EFA0C|nr:heparin sulfate O-sulfotransferase [Neocloeon triangulifer]